MFASRIVFAFAFALSLGACHRDRCLSVCQQREKELGCTPSESCKETCGQLHEASGSPCDAEFRGWEDCIVNLPKDQWECGIRGQPVPRETACHDARVKVMACITKFPQWPPPKG